MGPVCVGSPSCSYSRSLCDNSAPYATTGLLGMGKVSTVHGGLGKSVPSCMVHNWVDVSVLTGVLGLSHSVRNGEEEENGARTTVKDPRRMTTAAGQAVMVSYDEILLCNPLILSTSDACQQSPSLALLIVRTRTAHS